MTTPGTPHDTNSRMRADASADTSADTSDATSAAAPAAPHPESAPSPSAFARLVARELKLTDDETRGLRGERWLAQPPRSLFGIALSGGGIRSSTFNLGLLQGLNEIGLLRGMDYLATVSGGGYTGGFWTRWRLEHGYPGKLKGDVVFPGAVDTPGGGDGSMPLGDEPPEFQHLRRFSRFLAPNLGVFTFDTGRMLVALLNALVPSLLTSAAFLIAVAFVIETIAALVLVAPLVLPTYPTAFGLPLGIWVGAFAAMFTFGLLHLAIMSWFWRGRELAWHHFATCLIVLLILSGIWAATAGMFEANRMGPTAAFDATRGLASGKVLPWNAMLWLYVVAPAAATASLSVLNALVRPAIATFFKPRSDTLLAALDTLAGWFLFTSSAWLASTALWWVAFLIMSNGAADAIAVAKRLTLGGIPAAGLVTWLTRFVAKPSPGGERTTQLLGRASLLVAAYGVLCTLVVAAMLLVIAAHEMDRVLWLLVTTMVLIAISAICYDPNRVGFHEFYRARIVRAFLGAGRIRRTAHREVGGDEESRDDATEVQRMDDLALDQFDIRSAPNADNALGPLHLVVCAANDLTPRSPLASMSRGADSAVLSPVGFSVGTHWTYWREDNNAKPTFEDIPTLGAAITASAAAFNTQMGAKSIALGPAVTFLMTSLGLRLGLWLRHPALLNADRRRILASLGPDGKYGAPLSPVVRSQARLNFFSELVGRSDSRHGDWVFLSDGGHFDNTALYELVRRHCRFIIVSDCGEDFDRAYDDLGVAVRRVRVDFDVDVRINLEPLKPDASGVSRQPMVAGDIHYPDGDTGTLLVFKPTIVGTEPPDVLQYRARNAKFPHQSTVDQFYDEAQWESYRRLGHHAARIAFTTAAERERHPTLTSSMPPIAELESMDEVRDRMALEFSNARREWFARPTDYVARVERVATHLATLEGALAGSSARLMCEVNWELGERTPSMAVHTVADGMTADDLANSLRAIRQALVTFEAIFLSENLATQFNQPSYVGLMNVMARWLRAPLVRSCWPLLRAACTSTFRNFAEAQFDLKSARGKLALLSTAWTGDALALATQVRLDNQLRNDADVVIRLVMTMDDMVGDVHHRATRDDTARPTTRAIEVARLDANHSPSRRMVCWLARDLIVPPGLWGTGLGSEMLRELSPHVSGDARRAPAAVAVGGDGRNDAARDIAIAQCAMGQVVLVRTFRAGSTSAKKDSADIQQLYVQAGFECTAADQLDAQYAGEFVTAYGALHNRWKEIEKLLPTPDRILDPAETENFVFLHRRCRDVHVVNNATSPVADVGTSSHSPRV
jgi:hypothetical protein